MQYWLGWTVSMYAPTTKCLRVSQSAICRRTTGPSDFTLSFVKTATGSIPRLICLSN